MHIFLTASLKVDSLFDAQSTSVNINYNSLLGKYINPPIFYLFCLGSKNREYQVGCWSTNIKRSLQKGKEQSFLQIHDREDGKQSVSVAPRII